MTAHQFKVGDTGKTRDGRPYRIIMLDLNNPRPLVAAVTLAAGNEYVQVYHSTGCEGEYREHPVDLMPPPPATKRVVRWVVGCRHGGVAVVSMSHDEEFAIASAALPNSLMPDRKPLRIELDILERPA